MRILLPLFLIFAPLLKADSFAAKTKPLFEKYCVSCHGEEKQKGGIALHDLNTIEDAFKKHGLLESVIDQVQHEEMPPDDEQFLPTQSERKQLIDALSEVQERIESGDIPQRAGRTTLRRLNRTEYHYTVRDLFGIDFNPSKDFPADGAGGEGFDNMADALFSTPTLLEKYLSAAQEIITAIYNDPKLKRRVIFQTPEKPEQARTVAEKVLSFHATLAYRRRLSEADLLPLLTAFDRAMEEDPNFEKALRAPLTALLINPRFLFRAEHDEAGKEEWPLNDFELAARLSYFLWSSMPDQELFRVADSGKLRDPEILRAQVLRMIKSPKASALSHHFAGQWLGFDKMVDKVEPDKNRFPSFDLELRKAMYNESAEFFSHLVRENRPITDLIDSDYTFVNARLAEHYGLSAPPRGRAMQKITLTDKNRGGVLGMGSILTATSHSLRTSPVLRGVWILDTLIGDPAPPPPQDAGELPADDSNTQGLTFREQLAKHRERPSCAGCHSRIDPLGFSLENFDAIGRWRTKDINGQLIDSTATLPGDIEFSTPQELKRLIMAAKEKFARNLTRKLIAYATGRSLEYYDEAVVSKIVAKTSQSGLKMQDLLLEVIESRPFLNRSATR